MNMDNAILEFLPQKSQRTLRNVM